MFRLSVVLLLLAGTASAQESDEGMVEARLVGDPSPVAAEQLRPQLVRRDHTTATVLGATSAIIGGVGLVASWSLYGARQAYRLKPRSSISESTMDTWTNIGAYSFWIGASSSAFIVTAEYILLPESNDVPTLAWFAGGGGLVLAAVGVGFAVGGSHCAPQATRPGADLYLACSAGTADSLFGSLLLISSVPLINAPILYLLRKAFAGAPEPLSIGPGSLVVSGRF